MDLQLFSAYLLIGVGVSVGICGVIDTKPSLAERFTGRTRVAVYILFIIFWPVAIAALITLALSAAADK